MPCPLSGSPYILYHNGRRSLWVPPSPTASRLCPVQLRLFGTNGLEVKVLILRISRILGLIDEPT